MLLYFMTAVILLLASFATFAMRRAEENMITWYGLDRARRVRPRRINAA